MTPDRGSALNRFLVSLLFAAAVVAVAMFVKR